MRRSILTILFCGLAAVQFAAGASASETPASIAPKPTKPAEPRNPTDRLLRTALAETLKEPREFVPPPRGPVLLLRDGPHVSPHILPTGTGRGIAIVSAAQLEALATQAGDDDYYYLQVSVRSIDAKQAVVNVQLLPAIAKGSAAMCCWTIDRRYLRTATGWTFDRLVDEGVY